MRKNLFLTVYTLFFCCLLFKIVYAFDDGDFQVWHTEAQEFKLNKKLKAQIEEEVRLGDDGGNLYYHHYDVGLAYALSKGVTVGINYRQIYEKKSGEFKEENRPHLNLGFAGELFGFAVDDRNRLEYRHFNYQTDLWRYRNKLTIKLPWKFTRIEIQPYFSDEIFLDLNGGQLNKNRFYAGFGFKITKNIKAEMYYMLQNSKSLGKWTDANVLGSKLKLIF